MHIFHCIFQLLSSSKMLAQCLKESGKFKFRGNTMKDMNFENQILKQKTPVKVTFSQQKLAKVNYVKTMLKKN